MEINPLSDVLFTNMFSNSVGYLFILMISFAVQNLLVWCRPIELFILLYPLPENTYQKTLLWEIFEILLLMFSSRIFMVSSFALKSLIHFEFIFVYGVKRWSSFNFLHISVQFSPHNILNRLSLSHCMFLPPLSNINLL